MSAHHSSILFGLLFLQAIFLQCQASPVMGESLDGKKMKAAKGWLTLETGAPGTSKDDARVLRPTTSTSSIQHRAIAQTGHTAALPNQEASRPPSSADQQDMRERYARVLKKVEAAASGQQKRKDREAWLEAYPGKLPLVRYMTNHELQRIGLVRGNNRYKAIHYLEEKKLRRDGVSWPREEIEKPATNNRFRPLFKMPAEGEEHDSTLFKKQNELNELLEDEGLLITSDSRKRAASDLWARNPKRLREQQVAPHFQDSQG